MKRSIAFLLASVFWTASLGLAAQSVRVNPIPDLDPDFIKGADVSSLLAIEKGGGKFFDESGRPGDALAILKDHGVNWIRLRLWNDPTNAADVVVGGKVLSKKGEPSGGGDNDLSTDLVLAKRAKALGLKFLLDFHYSDFWADPSHQEIPKAWKGLDLDGLEQALHDYTKQTLKAFADEAAAPDMVQLGNETNGGMLWPMGKTFQAAPGEQIGGIDAFAGLLAAGSSAVRETDPGIRIAIHLADGGDHGLYRYMFDELTEHGLDYDIIGFSYYPYWHGPLDQLADNLNAVSVRYSKPVIVMETAYAWTLADADDYGNTFGPGMDKSGGYKATVQGQATEIRDVMAAVSDVPGGQGLGLFYWDPVSLPVKGSGWRAGEGNNHENQTLFDFHGKALPSMSVFKLVSGAQQPVDPVPLSAAPIKLTLALDQKTWEYPDQIQAAYSDDAYRMAPVTWTPLDRALIDKPQVASLRGVLTGTKVKAVAVVNVVPMSNILSDAGFESGTLGDWRIEGTPQTALVEKNPGNARTGDYTLKYWNDKAFLFTASRKVDGLKDGVYTAKLWAMGGGGEKSITWSAKSGDRDAVQALVHNSGWLKWNQYVLRNVPVTGGSLVLSIVVDGREGCWGNFDDVELTREGDLKP
jgi:arabinogalactan endo-1,4-beta-galactosidase